MTDRAADIRIYLADKRKAVRSTTSQSLFTLPQKVDEESVPVGRIKSFCEVTQKAGTLMNRKFSSTTVCILPLVGSVVVGTLHGEKVTDVGQLLFVRVHDTAELTFKNEFHSEWIAYLWWEVDAVFQPDVELVAFDLESSLGRLILMPSTHDPAFPVSVQIGMFNGRQDEILRSTMAEDKFVFVIEGAFEVQERLLHARDALSLPRNQVMEFEALSNNAMILVLSSR